MEISKENIAQIRLKLSEMKTKEDLLELINLGRKIQFGDDVSAIRMHQLTYFADPSLCSNRYKTFVVKKKSGGERQINAPVKGLRSILRALNLIFQAAFNAHHTAHGFVIDRSIATNANIHLRMNYVFNIDLKDFFHSFDRQRVKAALLNSPFNLKGEKEPLAFLIASLCTHPLAIDDEIKIVLPQGSPTSPTLTNVLCVKLDRRLKGLAKKHGAKYSRYADDITFSCNVNIFKNDSFKKELVRIIEEDQKLEINPKKTRLQTSKYRQEVTGLTVNSKPNVKSRYIKQIRMWIYLWERYGYLRAQHLFSNDYKYDKGHIMKGKPSMVNVLAGKLDFLKMIKGQEDSTYLKLQNRFEKLTASLGSLEKDLNEIIDLWETSGIEVAMKVYYAKYGADKIDQEDKETKHITKGKVNSKNDKELDEMDDDNLGSFGILDEESLKVFLNSLDPKDLDDHLDT